KDDGDGAVESAVQARRGLINILCMGLMAPAQSNALVGRDSFQGDGKGQKLLLGQVGRVLHLSDRAAARSAAWLMARRAANSAMRLPRCFAVSKSPDRGASSGEASAGDMA